MSLEGKNIIVGLTGSVAIYKSLDLMRDLKKKGANVEVIMTKSATRLFSKQLVQALGFEVHTTMFKTVAPIWHIDLARKTDLLLISPATANTIAKLSWGMADDLLSTVALATKGKKMICPAMNPAMWENPLTQENIRRLIIAGWEIVGPKNGIVACGDEGMGRLENLNTIELNIERVLSEQKLKGKKVLVTLGPTFEPLDPVRGFTNRSSGKMGKLIAREAFIQGAEVETIEGEMTAEEMFEEVKAIYKDFDIIFCVAAVCDYRPKKISKEKIKKGENLNIELEKTVDIAAFLGKNKKKGQKVIGFALESEKLEENAKKKLIEKGLDMIVGNAVETIGSDEIEPVLFRQNKKPESLGRVKKSKFAKMLV